MRSRSRSHRPVWRRRCLRGSSVWLHLLAASLILSGFQATERPLGLSAEENHRERLLELIDALSSWRSQWRFTGRWQTVKGLKASLDSERWLKPPRIETRGWFAVSGPMVRLELETPTAQQELPRGAALGGEPASSTGLRIIRQDWHAGLQCVLRDVEKGLRFGLYPLDTFDWAPSTTPPFFAVDTDELLRIWFLEHPEAELLQVARELDKERNRMVYTIYRRARADGATLIDRYELDVSGAVPLLIEARWWQEGKDPSKAWVRRNEQFVTINGVAVPQRMVSYDWVKGPKGEEVVFLRVCEITEWNPAPPEPTAFVVQIGKELRFVEGLPLEKFPKDGKIDVAKLTRDDLRLAPSGHGAVNIRLRDGKPWAISEGGAYRRLDGGELQAPTAAAQTAASNSLLWLTVAAVLAAFAVVLAARYLLKKETT